MFNGKVRCVLAVGLLMPLAGCHEPLTGNQMASAKMDETRCSERPYFQSMVDNAMLQDMSLSDIHFVPHTTEISGTGAARLDRMARLLDAYGGTVRYETEETNQTIVSQRMEHVREYLAMSGCDMNKVQVKTMLSGGRGMSADRAVMIHDRSANMSGSGAVGTPTPGGAGAGGGQPGGRP